MSVSRSFLSGFDLLDYLYRRDSDGTLYLYHGFYGTSVFDFVGFFKHLLPDFGPLAPADPDEALSVLAMEWQVDVEGCIRVYLDDHTLSDTYYRVVDDLSAFDLYRTFSGSDALTFYDKVADLDYYGISVQVPLDCYADSPNLEEDIRSEDQHDFWMDLSYAVHDACARALEASMDQPQGEVPAP